MTPRFGRRAAAIASAAAGALVAVTLLGAPAGAGEGGIEGSVRDARPAGRPFRGMTETTVQVGGSTMTLVIADEPTETFQGLRRRRTLGRYDGMLFVFPGGSRTAFTMSTVPVPLDIGFYDARGRVVDRLRMVPCSRSDDECPLYRADGEFEYALETLAGALPRGRLRAGS